MLSYIEQTSKYTLGDFPGNLVVKNPPSNAGDAGSIPGLGTKIPHAIRKAHVPQLRPHAVINIIHLCIYIYIHIYMYNNMYIYILYIYIHIYNNFVCFLAVLPDMWDPNSLTRD